MESEFRYGQKFRYRRAKGYGEGLEVLVSQAKETGKRYRNS